MYVYTETCVTSLRLSIIQPTIITLDLLLDTR